MWEEWRERILSAHGPEDYAARRLRIERIRPAESLGEEPEAEPAVAAAPAREPCEIEP